MRFSYVMDPMCGWCFGFQPELEAFLAKHPSVEMDWIMGGLAPDTNHPMDENLRNTISSYWHQIEQQTKVTFNHEFWKLNTPYRATYPACRSVIAAECLRKGSAHQMVKAIQSAYYKEAKNPSLRETLVACASSIHLDEIRFSEALNSEETEYQLQQHLRRTQQLQVSGFPALFFIDDRDEIYPLTLGYCETAHLEHRFNHLQAQ